jgi:serine/threonine-protein kinase
MSVEPTDRNLLFGVLALQADFLDAVRFAEACSAWAGRKDTPLADLLVERGLLTAEQRALVDLLLRQKLHKHGGDARAGLAAVATPEVRSLLESVADADVRQSLADLPAPAGPALPSTVAYEPDARQRYTLTRLHARGGIGQVWLAHDEDLGRDVALKELRPDRRDNPAATARFLGEAQITGQLEHPGIVPVYELVQPRGGPPCYAMRFVGGRTLADTIQGYHRRRLAGAAGPLDLRELLTAFIGVSNAVAYAHSRGVLHRDLKPQNVALGDFGEVLVLDWGLAKVLGRPEEPTGLLPVALGPADGSDRTQQGQVLGTPAYMAPEQARGRPDLVDRRSDVYGLGAILYEVLTGQPPFAGAEAPEVIRRVVQEAPVPPRAVVAAMPAALEAVCLKALAKTPADRYASATDLATEVRHYLADEPVAAYRDPLLARGGRWARRHRMLVTGLAAAALVAVVSLTAATVLLSAANHRETEARKLAQQRGEEAEREGAKARANFQLARDAVEEYGTKVSSDPRLKEKDLEELRKELLQSAVKFHQQFVEQHRDDPALLADLGQAAQDLANLVGDVGDNRGAIHFARQAVAAYEQLAAKHPEEVAHRLALARSLDVLGLLLDRSAEAQESRVAYSRAVETLEEARRAHGGSSELRETYAAACGHLGAVLRYKLGAQAEAIAVCRRGAAFLQDEGEAAPRPLEAVRRAMFPSLFGLFLAESGAKDEATVWCKKAVQLLEPLAPGDPDFEVYRASVNDYLGRAHWALRDLPAAQEAFRQELGLLQKLTTAHPGVGLYQDMLGRLLTILATVQMEAGQPAEALASFKRAVEVKESLVARYPELPDHKANLARGLYSLALHTRDLAEARAYQRRAESLLEDLTGRYPKVDQYQAALGQVYRARSDLHERANQLPQAIQALDEAIAVMEGLVRTTDVAQHRRSLVGSYERKIELCLKAGELEPAAGAYRKATALDAGRPETHYLYGDGLLQAGRLEEALAASQKALALRQDFAEAQCNLGHCLVRMGRFAEGRDALQRGHELGSKQPGWRHPSAQWVRDAEALIRLDHRLPAILEGKEQPANAGERLTLAILCGQMGKRLYAASARFYREAFAAEPKLADDPRALHRYNAACAAALAGCGLGKDSAGLDDGEKARLRRQALDWLKADLARWASRARGDRPADRTPVRQALRRWKEDPDLAGVRGEALAKLPGAEREPWKELWQEVDAVLTRLDAAEKKP